MKQILLTWTVIVVGCLSSFAQYSEPQQNFYFFNSRYLESSLRHEVGMSIGVHWTKSPMITTYTKVQDGVAYPEPVFTRAFGIASATYEPRARLIEFRSSSSLTLDLPMTGAFSIVDVLSGSGFKYSAEPLTEAEISSNIFARERNGFLGAFHVEGGALLSINIGQGATIENTYPIGLSLGAGVNYIHGPLIMNFLQNDEREFYKGFMGWATPVGRIGFHADRIVFYYMIGIAPTRVIYQTGDTFGPQTEMTNTYNRLSLSYRLGK